MPDQQEPISYKDFAKKIKTKYPEYKDIDDLTLSKKMVEKYPDYSGIVQFEEVKKKEPSVSLDTQSPSREFKSMAAPVLQFGASLEKSIKPSIREAALADKKNNESYLGALWNNAVGSASRLARGATRLASKFEANPAMDIERRILDIAGQSMNKNLVAVKEKEYADKVGGFIEKARTSASSKEYEKKLAEGFDITDGVGISDLKALGAMIPQLIADMGVAIPTAGASFAIQGYDDALSLMDEMPEAQNISEGTRTAFGFGGALVIGALEKLGLDNILKNPSAKRYVTAKVLKEATDELVKKGVKVTAEQFEKQVADKAKEIAKKEGSKVLAKSFLKKGAIEGGTEAGQEAAMDLLKIATNKIEDKEIFDEEEMKDTAAARYLNSFAAGGVLGGLAGAVATRFQNTEKAIKSKLSEAKTQEDIASIVDEINQNVQEGTITEDEANDLNSMVQSFSEVSARIPQEVIGENREKSIDLILERNRLESGIQDIEKQKEGVDSAYHGFFDEGVTESNKRIEEINKELAELAKPENQIIETEETTEVPIQAETKVGEPKATTETIGTTEVTEAEPIQEEGIGISQKGIERAEAKKIYKKVNETDIPNDAEGIALSYLAGGGKISEAAINEVAGRVKRARLNTGEREFKSEEARARDYYQKEGKNLDDIAHELWEASSQEIPEIGIKNALMDAIANNNTRLDAAKQYLERYNPEYAEEQYYNQLYEQKKAEVEAEEAEINKWLAEEGEVEFELSADEEYINQLIKKYETDLETEVEQPTTESQRTSSEKVSSEESVAEAKPTTTDTAVEPPKPPKKTAPIGEGQGESTGGITLAASEERRKAIGIEGYEKEAESFEEWEAEANKKISEGFDVEKMLDDLLESGRAATPVENAIRKIYAANLDAEIAKNPTNELLAKAKKLSEVGDLLNSRAGRQLVSLKGEAAPRENITDFYVAKMEANGVDELTDAQKAEVKRQYEKVKKASEEAELRIQELERLNSELQAQNEVLKLKKEKKAPTTKKTKEQYAAERTKIIDDIKDKLKKARTGESGLTAIPVPYAKELIAIAPDVAKLLKIYVEEGIDNLQAVSKKIYEDLKEGFPELTQKDIVDVIAGKYRKEKPQKTELDQKLKDIQTEAKLIAKIEEAMSVEPDSEKGLIDKNRTVKELQDQLRQLRKETGYYDESKLKSIAARNNAEADKLRERIANKDFEEKPKVSFLENPELKKKHPKLYEEYLNSIVEKRDAKHEFEVALAKDAAAKMTKTQKAFKFGKEALNTVKAIKSGVDDSFVFVQGGLAVLANPKAGAKSFINQWKNFFNEGRFKREIVRIHENKPLWNVIEKTGLDILDPKGLQDKLREEQLGGTNLLEKEIKIPGTNKKFIPAKYTTAPFERLYTSMGNSLRLEIFLKKMEQEGWTLEKNEQQLKDLARVVNEMTGRGRLHKKLEPASDAISAVIWSPKLLASTVNLMGVGDVGNFVLGGQKGYYRSLSPELRKFAIKQTAAGIGMGVLIMAAYSLDPDKEVDYDPQSVTFGQIKDKKTGISYNIFGRFTSVARYITMMATGKRTVDEKGQKISTARETWKFFRGKFNPVAGVASDAIITKKTFDGRPYELSELPKDLLMPISIGDIKKSMDEEGTLGLLTRGIPSFLGIKVMNEKDFTGVDKDLSTLIKRNAISSELDLDKYKNYKKGEAAPTKEEKKEFINKRDNYIEQRLRALWEGTDEMNIVIDENGKVVTKKFSDMNKDQAVDATTKIKSDATRKFKEEIFGEKELTRKEEKAQDKLEIARDRVNRKNNFD